ncbi:mitofusin [Tulasnella sp. 419]|nr:mitofusin [Tulasnella sp. 419]
MVGGKTIGVRGLIEAIARVSEMVGNPHTRKWLAPAVGAATLGLTVYCILELPNTIPRSVGRNIKSTLSSSSANSYSVKALVAPQPSWVEYHKNRVMKETRTVMRVAAWNVKEKHRVAKDDLEKEFKGAEEVLKRATGALEFFDSLAGRTADVRVNLVQ